MSIEGERGRIDMGDEARRGLKWGVLGAARIAGKALVPAIEAAGGKIVCIGASTLERAEAFAREHGIERACGYQGVVENEEVEAVYLPLSNALHYEWAKRAAEGGKAVLCEKPLALTAKEARELRRTFGETGLCLQEAFMWRHHPQVAWLREQIEQGRLGELQRVHATFSFWLDRPEDYRWKADQGGGATWDIGCYCVNAARHFFGCEPGAGSARAEFTKKETGVDASAAGWLDFGGGRHATFSCSFRAGFSQGIELVGTRGRASMERPWLQVDRPTRVTIERDEKLEVREFEPINAYVSMIEHFTRCVREGNRVRAPAEDGLEQAIVMEGLIESERGGGAVWNPEA